MTDEKDVRAVSRIAIGSDIGWNEIVNQTIEGGNRRCKFGFDEKRAAFCKYFC
jgi:hypothetical protein